MTFFGDSQKVTEREELRSLASIYNRLGVGSPLTLVGKMVFRESCNGHLP